MSFLISSIKLVRPVNVVMAAATTALGIYLVQWQGGARALFAAIGATICSTAFGNIINDIHDVPVDSINRPKRVLVTGAVSVRMAVLFAVLLGIGALICAWVISPWFVLAVSLPLFLLLIYTRWLKATVLWGNGVVSLLVAYPLLFGAMVRPEYVRFLYLPALCAFGLNLCREIIKDVQDQPGDSARGLKTSAALPSGLIKIVLVVLSILYGAAALLVAVQDFFGTAYLIVCLVATIPLHIWWLVIALSKQWRANLSQISRIIKIEMVAGLGALLIDAVIRRLA